MKPALSSLRRLIFGETWTIPLGVGAALALAVLMRAALPETAWETLGGFCLAVLVLAALAHSLPSRDSVDHRGGGVTNDGGAARPRQRSPGERS